MDLEKSLAASIAVVLLSASGAARAAPPHPCRTPTPGTSAAPIFSPPIVYRVIGAGRLPFYTAPDAHCPMPGVFVVPEDELIVYELTNDGWASVMYVGGDSPTGWVRFSRLKSTGGAVGPKQ